MFLAREGVKSIILEQEEFPGETIEEIEPAIAEKQIGSAEGGLVSVG